MCNKQGSKELVVLQDTSLSTLPISIESDNILLKIFLSQMGWTSENVNVIAFMDEWYQVYLMLCILFIFDTSKG